MLQVQNSCGNYALKAEAHGLRYPVIDSTKMLSSTHLVKKERRSVLQSLIRGIQVVNTFEQTNVIGGHFLKEDIGLFDANFFNMTPDVAAVRECQQGERFIF